MAGTEIQPAISSRWRWPASKSNGGTGIRFGHGCDHDGPRVVAAPGSTLVVPADGYYQTRRFAVEYLEPVGVTVIQASADQMCEVAAEADVVLVESPTNPGLDVVDLYRLAAICRSGCTAVGRQHHSHTVRTTTALAGS